MAEDLAIKFAGNDKNNVVNTMKIAGEDQVMLKVRIAEVQRDVFKQFGIDFQALISAGKFAFNLASINPFANDVISSSSGYAGSWASGGSSVDAVIRAMEGDGLVRTLAEPNLTAVSGQTANFHAGGEFPYRVCSGSGADYICSVEFKEFGVQLNFTPLVLDKGRINMKIKTEVSDLQYYAGYDVPGLSTRNAETVVELPSGGSMMLAGLIKDTVRQNINGTPGLKRLPVLGALFRSKDYVQNETELVVIVTPYIVGPQAGQNVMSAPTDALTMPSDRDSIIWGRLNKIYGTAARTPAGTYTGDVGFIVE
jgi:pilus assembly protein CpaC